MGVNHKLIHTMVSIEESWFCPIKKPSGVKSALLGNHGVCPHLSIHRPGTWTCRTSMHEILDWRTAPQYCFTYVHSLHCLVQPFSVDIYDALFHSGYHIYLLQPPELFLLILYVKFRSNATFEWCLVQFYIYIPCLYSVPCTCSSGWSPPLTLN